MNHSERRDGPLHEEAQPPATWWCFFFFIIHTEYILYILACLSIVWKKWTSWWRSLFRSLIWLSERSERAGDDHLFYPIYYHPAGRERRVAYCTTCGVAALGGKICFRPMLRRNHIIIASHHSIIIPGKEDFPVITRYFQRYVVMMCTAAAVVVVVVFRYEKRRRTPHQIKWIVDSSEIQQDDIRIFLCDKFIIYLIILHNIHT